MRARFIDIKLAASIYGVNVERSGKKYEVWTTGSMVAECNNLKEVVLEVENFIKTEGSGQ